LRPISLYWWRPKQGINLGDAINPTIVSALSGRKVNYAPMASCDLLAIGSVLTFPVDNNMLEARESPIHVWGSGLIEPRSIVSNGKYAFSAVRGPLTRALVETSSQLPLGDPGILASRFWKASAEKTHKWGIIPHHTQLSLPYFRKMLDETPNSVLIDFTVPDIASTLRQLSSCELIVSTSLHGLIIADSYGIPNIWLKNRDIHKGKSFKFFDYFASVGRPDYEQYDIRGNFNLDSIDVTNMSDVYLRNVARIQDGIANSFPAIS
jgi:hypothetical protein